MTKLDNTSETAIAITFLVMNISTWLRRVFCVFLCHKPKITPIYGSMIIKSYTWASYSQPKVMFRRA